jgi:hypothetical protein
MIALLIAVVVAWSWVCVTAGRIVEMRYQLRRLQQAEAADLTARDAWMTSYERKDVA